MFTVWRMPSGHLCLKSKQRCAISLPRLLIFWPLQLNINNLKRVKSFKEAFIAALIYPMTGNHDARCFIFSAHVKKLRQGTNDAGGTMTPPTVDWKQRSACVKQTRGSAVLSELC